VQKLQESRQFNSSLVHRPFSVENKSSRFASACLATKRTADRTKWLFL